MAWSRPKTMYEDSQPVPIACSSPMGDTVPPQKHKLTLNRQEVGEAKLKSPNWQIRNIAKSLGEICHNRHMINILGACYFQNIQAMDGWMALWRVQLCPDKLYHWPPNLHRYPFSRLRLAWVINNYLALHGCDVVGTYM